MRILNIGVARPGGLVALGRVVAAHGIKGEIKVASLSGRLEELGAFRALTLLAQPGDARGERDVSVQQARPQGGALVVRLAGCADRDQAEELRGLEVCVARERLPGPPANTLYWHELEGVGVATGDGRSLGELTGLLATPAHDILVVTGETGEYLIPAVDSFVSGLDPAGNILLVDPPPGLLELNR